MSVPGKTLTDREFRILLTFLLDHNQQTVALVRQQVRTAIENQPSLRGIIASITEMGLRHEAQSVVEQMQLEKIRLAFRRVVRATGDADLETGLALLARFVTPDATPESIAKTLDQIAERVDRRMAKEQALPTRPINAMQSVLFEEEEFQPDTKTPNDPENMLLDRVLSRRVGSSYLLSAVYLLVGRRLNLLVHGVALPGHFIVGHRIPRGVVFIDPQQEGRILRKKDCEVLVRRNGFTFREEHLDPVSSRDILARCLVQMIGLYSEQGAMARAQALSRLYRLIPDQSKPSD